MSRKDKPHWPAPIPRTEQKPGRPCTPLISIREDGLGPAMLALTPAMRAFVVAKITYGCSNAEAARLAGYSVRSPHSADVHGSRLAHDQRIQAALLEEGQKLMRSEGPRSIHTLVSIRDDAKADNKDRMKAAIELLNRSGFHALSEHLVSVEHHMTDAEKDRRILALCSELGIGEVDARKMLIAPEKVIDAEFSVVEPEQPLSPEDAAKRERENELRRAREAMTPEERAAHKAAMREERRAQAKAKYAFRTGREGLEDLLP